MGRVNARGFVTLVDYETRRWTRQPLQYIAAPAVNTLLLFTVFRLALPDVGAAGGLAAFVVPGLTMMVVLHTAFETTAWSIIDLKVRGTIVDLLMPPLGTLELAVAFALNGALRGITVGALVLALMAPIAGLGVDRPAAAAAFAAGGALALALAGIVVGVEAVKFDHVATLENFIVVPLAFLSGSFYAVGDLAEPWRSLSFANPLFHAVDGFRAALGGAAQGGMGVAAAVVAGAVLVLGALAWHRLARSPKLRP
ncbi:MAG: ABC transporter permease [Alphaproteobacteria bacterium]